jgi:hypothetical protein
MAGPNAARCGEVGHGGAFNGTSSGVPFDVYRDTRYTCRMEFTIRLTGTRPLLMHNARLSNPLDTYAKAMKEIHSKHKKTEDDYVALANREWLGAVYHGETEPRDLGIGDIGPYIPGQNIERMLVDSAKITRDGQNIKRGVLILSDYCPLVYNGPRDLKTLSVDGNYRFMASVKVGVQRVMRCRPRFLEWSVSAMGDLDKEILDPDEFSAIATRAGHLIGLGDWRPRYGRFTAEVSWS